MSVKIDDDLVLHIAKLARLKIPEKDLKSYADHLSKILVYVDSLSNIPTDNITPLSNPMKDMLLNSKEMKNWGREDVVFPSLPAEAVLQNAPDQQLNQFKVEAVIEE